MESLELKTSSGASAQAFSAVTVVLDYLTDEERYSNEDWYRYRTVYAKWKRWTITFPLLSTTLQDYLLGFVAEEEPQFIYASTTYNVEVEESDIKHQGATLVLVNRDPE